MDLTYKIIPIYENDELKKSKPVKNGNFLHESISKQILVYEIDEYQKIYSIFGYHFLIVKETENNKTFNKIFKKIEQDTFYQAHYSTQILTDEEISKTLRNSMTLQISKNNTYDSDIKVVVCEKGFIWCNKYNFDNTNKFEMTLILFLIAISYNKKSTEILSDVSNSYQGKSYKEMIKTRDEIYDFDLKYFFENPVKQDRHQQYDIWKIIEKNYHIIDIHNEIKSRVVGLTNIIETNGKNKKTDTLTIIGLVISIISLIISIFNKLQIG